MRHFFNSKSAQEVSMFRDLKSYILLLIVLVILGVIILVKVTKKIIPG